MDGNYLMYNIQNFSQHNFLKLQSSIANSNSVAISIITKPNEVFALSDKWKDSIQLIIPDDDFTDKTNQLENILDFINNNLDAKNIYIHCYFGISRSAAINLFLREYLNQEVIQDLNRSGFSTHNRHIYRGLYNIVHSKFYVSA